ncbi:MAG: YidC/Oxa1 family membrane protein insertase [Erysipelotrichaceae bacterium]|nr:YidC/Oxa1 family membrane protein insertase [Erysipelotrichaceae bacterium]
MCLDQRTKKYLKIVALIAIILVLAGCTSNLDSDGKLIAERAITADTEWSMSAGWFDFLLTIPIAKGILWVTDLTGNVAWGVVALTIFINLLILPIMVRSTVSSQKMQLLQPELEKIQRKYAGRNDQASQMRQSAEMQALYKKHGVSMWSSLITFITLPIMLAMYQAVQRIEVLYSTTFLTLQLGNTPMEMITSGHFQYFIVVALVGLAQYFAIEINNIMARRSKKYRRSQQEQSMKMMNYVMIAMIVWFSLSLPTAMSLYWITTSVITIVRTVFIQIFVIEKNDKKKK